MNNLQESQLKKIVDNLGVAPCGCKEYITTFSNMVLFDTQHCKEMDDLLVATWDCENRMRINTKKYKRLRRKIKKHNNVLYSLGWHKENIIL